MPYVDQDKARECRRKWYERNKESQRAHQKAHQLRRHLKGRYGLSLDDYAKIKERQEGKCAICKQDHPKLYVDHEHKSGVVRGLLCSKCNFLLGNARESTNILQAAIEYLKEWRQNGHF